MARTARAPRRAGARWLAVALLVATSAGMASAAADTPPKVAQATPVDRGDKMPSAALLDPGGKPAGLDKVWASRPAIIVFYRGDW